MDSPEVLQTQQTLHYTTSGDKRHRSQTLLGHDHLEVNQRAD